MKKIRVIALVSAIAFMLLVGYFMASSNSSKNSVSKNVTEVLVANNDIPANSIVTETAFKKIQVLSDTVSPNAIKNVNDVVGKMTKSTIYANEIVLKDHLIEKTEGDNTPYGLSHIITTGKRAMSVDVVVSQGVSSFLKVGNYVDILYNGAIEFTVFDGSSSSKDEEMSDKKISKDFTKLLLQDIKVVGLDSNKVNGSDVKDSADNKIEYKTITLEITPEEFMKLNYARKNGELWFALRPQGDHEKIEVNDIIIDDLVDKAKLIKSLKEEYER